MTIFQNGTLYFHAFIEVMQYNKNQSYNQRNNPLIEPEAEDFKYSGNSACFA
jgi:hypothetical protein